MLKVANKKKLNPISIQTNKSIAELHGKRQEIRAQVEFRRGLLEPQERINYKNESDRLQGAKKLPGLDANTKSRMQELQKKARQSLKGEPSHRIYSTKL